ncbi:RING-H2 finger protein ATL60 [Apostasia shenzhenica]|uniref:RING-H2 finger protein ATL60 n=1 Tax=Apostasia shenzhenica TaxID=1088818 RepID=A0A2I0AFD7_9ASPA|nr:RING-H2 finger protein ATL60 [Apostasia shenzhenica]
MTSALQLLYIWKSRARRSQHLGGASEADPSDPDPDPDFRRHRRDISHGRRRGDVDSSRRSYAGASKGRHSKYCGSHKERELGRSVSSAGDYFCPGNSSNGGVCSSRLSRLGLIKNDHLPGAVLEARKRLIERLGSVSLTESRLGDEAPILMTNSKTPYCDSTSIPTEQAMSSHFSNKKKPPTRIWEALHSLKPEIFKSSEEKDGGRLIAELPDCSICLEKFVDGDELVRLCCNHKFHPCCLEPWLQSNGDCPYCRRTI